MASLAPLAAQQAVPDEKDRQAEPEPGAAAGRPDALPGLPGAPGEC